MRQLICCYNQYIRRLPPDIPEPATVPVQIIGNYNVFETDCICEAFKVGDNNILEIKGMYN